MTAEASAPAKINLTLHITGRRADGYHLIDSLVVFADIGDRVSLHLDTQNSLTVSGPMSSGVPSDCSNLVIRAANLVGVCAAISLEKHLPNAAGIGGGSSDAGAVLRLLAHQSGQPVPEDGLSLGADVPVCLHAKAARMEGIGDQLTFLHGIPPLHAVLVNPGVAVPTGAVFANLTNRTNAPMPTTLPSDCSASELTDWLLNMRNDLEAPAIAAQPIIGDVLKTLANTQDCRLARMSGSGATCFGLYPSTASAQSARDIIATAYPDWWVIATQLNAQTRGIN